MPYGQQTRGYSKGPYERRASNKNAGDPYAYIETRSGEYDERERRIVQDAYADGWAYAERGGELWQLPPHLGFCHKGNKEAQRLFRLGFANQKAGV